jgi:NAD-dependent deacetylase
MIQPDLPAAALQNAALLLRYSRSPVVLTGAGVSRESGIPTFREAQTGLWAQYDPTELATPRAFERNPKLVWDFYDSRRQKLRGVQPNPGHYALAELEKRYPTLSIITQNVDDLHEKAGSQRVIHLHGRLMDNKCSANCKGNPTPVNSSTWRHGNADTPPACPYCGAYVRPDVVWFEEVLPEDALGAAYAACDHADLMLVIGTSAMVVPAAYLPAYAKAAGANIIEINPYQSEITRAVDLWIAAPSGEALPQLVGLLDTFKA